MSNPTVAARLAADTTWTQIPVARVAGCDHTDTVCSGCWESWDLDWTFEADDVPAAIADALQFAGDVELVRSLATTTPFADLVAGMRNNGRSEQRIAEVLAEAANG